MNDTPRDKESWARREEAYDRFEDEWTAGQRPSIEDFLANVALREREDLLRELLRLELFYRRKGGETPAAQEYHQRFPEQTIVVAGAWGDTDHATTPGRPGAAPTVPGYEILEELGRGGMGVVYRVRDPDLQRELAIKVLLPNQHLSPEMVRRFIEEAQVTGQLQHPGVPPVHERGQLADGRPFFTMKLIQGQTLAALLVGRSGPDEDRPRFVGVFEQVCQAVAYAHSKRVIHRDLKPANVMVGAFGEVQVMDWGLAKVLLTGDHQVPETDVTVVRTVRTETPGQSSQAGAVQGTFAFMAPEQARGEIDKVDERCDVFGLGAILCVILTGKPPYQAQTAEEVYRLAAEGELAEAVTRLEGCGADAALVGLAKSCLAADREQRPRNSGEVATGVTGYRASVEERLRATERERAAAQARAEEAKARQAAETRAREAAEAKVAETQAKVKAERRARRLFAGLALAVLLLGGSGLWWAWQRADQQSDVTAHLEEVAGLLSEWKLPEARSAMERAEGRVAGNAPDSLRRQVLEMRDNLTLVDLLDQIRLKAVAWVDGKFDNATADREYAGLFHEQGLGDDTEAPAEVVMRIQQRSAIKAQLVAALDDWAVRAQKGTRVVWLLEVARRADPDPWRDSARDPAVWDDRTALARLVNGKAVAEQSPQLLVALGMRLRELGGDAEGGLRAAQERHPADFWVNFLLGNALLIDKKKPEEAVGFYRAALALRPGTFAVYNNLGGALKDKGKVDEAMAAYRKAIDLDSKFAMAHYNLGVALLDKGKVDEAISEYRQAIALDPKDAKAHTGLGNALARKGKVDEAIAEFRKAILLDPKSANAHTGLGLALRDKGKVDEAIAEYRKSVELDPKDATAHCALGNALSKQGKVDEAMAAYRKAIELEPKYANAHTGLGLALRDKGKVDEAIAEYRKSVELDPKLALAHNNLGLALHAKGKVDEAISEYRKAIELDPRYATAHIALGNALAAKGKVDEAIAEYRKAIQLDPKHAEAHCNLAGVLVSQGRLTESLESYRRGHALGAKRPGWPYPSALWVRQVERLVLQEKELLDVLSGKRKPDNATERIKYTSLCTLTRRYASSARLYADAFVEQPTLADDLQAAHRYNAAGTAALAGCGQGQDAPKPDDKERVRLRQQALVWLRADLALWGKQVEKGTPEARAVVQKKLQRWQKDSSLAGVRDAAALEKLPEGERAEWKKLWVDVGVLLKKCEERRKE